MLTREGRWTQVMRLSFLSSFMIGGLNRIQTGGRLNRNFYSIHCEETQTVCDVTFWRCASAWHESEHYFGRPGHLTPAIPPLLLFVVYVRVILRNHLTPAHHEREVNVFIIDFVIPWQVLILVSTFLSNPSSAERPKKFL